MNKVIVLFKDKDPLVTNLYDALLDVIDERATKMSFATIIGTLESLKLKIMLEMQ